MSEKAHKIRNLDDWRAVEEKLFVGDYERLVRLLLSHPKVKDLEYNEKEGMLSAVFEDPYWAEEEKRCQYYVDDEISARDLP